MKKEHFFIPELDSLRFIAFLLIFIHHTDFTNFVALNSVRDIGWIGVDIFFCLSAFLLTRLLRLECQETGSISIVNFFVRRILRIWPLYFSYITGAILFALYTHSLTHQNWYRALSLATFTDNIVTAFDHYNPIRFTAHLWTIGYEEQFYLLLPLIVLLLFRKTPKQRHIFFLIALVGGITVRIIFIQYQIGHPAIWVLPVTHCESILLGIFIGFIEINQPKFLMRVAFSVFAILGFATIYFLSGPAVLNYSLLLLYPCIGVTSASLLCVAIYSNNTFIKKILRFPPFVYLGKISFGLYILHTFCFAVTDHLLRTLHVYSSILAMGISLLILIVFASLSYQLLEKRFLSLKTRYTIIPSRMEGVQQ